AGRHRHRLRSVVVVDREALALANAVRRHADADDLGGASAEVGTGVRILGVALLLTAEQADDAALDGQLGLLDLRVIEADLEALVEVELHLGAADDRAAHGDDDRVRSRGLDVDQTAAAVLAVALARRDV